MHEKYYSYCFFNSNDLLQVTYDNCFYHAGRHLPLQEEVLNYVEQDEHLFFVQS